MTTALNFGAGQRIPQQPECSNANLYGEILFDYNKSGSGTVQNDKIQSYIPHQDGTIQTYFGGSSVQFTVIGSLTGEFSSGAPNLAAVNNVTVDLANRTFLGIGPVLVIMLFADVAAMHAAAQSLAYQITVLVDQRSMGRRLRLSGDNRTGIWEGK